MYDFTPDISELQNELDGMYEELSAMADGPFTDSEDVGARDKAYGELTGRVGSLDKWKIGASPELAPEAKVEFGLKGTDSTKGLPFLSAFTLLLMSRRLGTYRKTEANVHESFRKQTNERFYKFRRESVGAKTKKELVELAKANVPSIPDKVAAKAGKFQVAIHPDFDARYERVVKKATDYLLGKDFKIRSQEIVGNLKKKLQETLAVGYSEGETGKALADRIRTILGDGSDAETIAITEIADAANHAEYEYASEYRDRYGIEVIKTWHQIPRKSMRKTHSAVSGQSLRFEEKFYVDGEYMERPHDPSASARNVIRCGCYMTLETGKAALEKAAE